MKSSPKIYKLANTVRMDSAATLNSTCLTFFLQMPADKNSFKILIINISIVIVQHSTV